MNLYRRLKQVFLVTSYVAIWFGTLAILETATGFIGLKFEGLVVTLTILAADLAIVLHYAEIREQDLENRKDDALVKLLALTQILMVGSAYYILMAAQF